MKNSRKIIAIAAAALMMFGTTGMLSSCGASDSKKADTATEAVTDDFLGENENDIDFSNASPLYKKLDKVVTADGVDGYFCGRLAGSANYYLVTKSGKGEDMKYKFYKIALKGPKYEGELDAANTEGYIDLDTATLGLYQKDGKKWQYGLVNAGDKITVDYSNKGTAKNDNDFPRLHGGKAEFSKPSDKSQLAIFS